MRQFDFYEFAGVIAPGMVGLLGVAFVWPEMAKTVLDSNVSVGGFGVAVVLAYVAGHLLQALGNLIEALWWRINRGWPSDWPRSGRRRLLAAAQQRQLELCVREHLAMPDFHLSPDTPKKDWRPVFRQVCASVRSAGKYEQAQTLTGNYGLCRGVASALAVLAVVAAAVQGREAWGLVAALAVGEALAIYRMHRFAVHYAQEVFVSFLELPRRAGSGESP